MEIDDKVRNETRKYNIGAAAKCHHYHLEKLINISMLEVNINF